MGFCCLCGVVVIFRGGWYWGSGSVGRCVVVGFLGSVVCCGV